MSITKISEFTFDPQLKPFLDINGNILNNYAEVVVPLGKYLPAQLTI
jgi:hypothetical protein